MLPVVAIVGRPNVGKSTLFNALTRTRDALVADMPGVTRDRQYGISRVGQRSCLLVDTGGLITNAEGIDYLTAQQVEQAIDESTTVLFLVSARDGLTADDEQIAARLRKSSREVVLVANKMDGLDEDVALADFARLGMGEPLAVTASHRRGLDTMMEAVIATLPAEVESEQQEDDEDVLRLAVVGRPNVGKSTLVNRLLGEERVLAYDQPGTTRDTIRSRLERDGRQYELIDTAGVRRRSRVTEAVEKFSTIKALQAIERAHVVVLMLDAREGLTDQDTTLLGHILEQGRALVIVLNKWDGLDPEHRKRVKSELDRKLTYVDWAQRVTMSALHGSGIQEMLDAVHRAWASALADFSTPELTRVVKAAFEAHQPPMKQGRVAKLRYAHSGGKLPPRIIIHGSRTDTIPDSYRRYLVNRFIKHFKLRGTPVFISFRNSDNPYKDRKNVLTRRQKEKRKRLKKFTGRKSRK
ncbi:MAG: ribosome biogenesis GTPase Der [Xanthomonadales bacterium]|nr:ribosome biogenesis GTPase Der [Gammaproteobacteria bacterium]MBT8052139.1 ribosome biogenesis GTPase Der [Gammaproteobacteria bacterium]MBT8056824.1 ribosome biogenesis GTPase Der [Gammaproteobacteria bacterium]NNJ79474.1 ribosome biogenesis GTPase Der [Xanthomonadales bacterium]NNL05612.1 ribosome biogenesis GTPase Der [Xanthomonadales bacterium]